MDKRWIEGWVCSIGLYFLPFNACKMDSFFVILWGFYIGFLILYVVGRGFLCIVLFGFVGGVLLGVVL